MSAKAQKNDNIRRFVNSAEVDIFLTTKNNVAWHKLLAQHCLHKCTRGWWESLHITMAHNMTDPHSRVYQPGGVGVFSINHAAHRVQSFGSNPTSLRRYCWMLLTRCKNKKLQVVAAYHPSKSNNGHLSVMQQHWRYFAKQNQADNTVPHPRTQFWIDLKPIIQSWIDTGKQVIISLDVNQQVNHLDVTAYFNTLGLTEAILHRHGTDAPPMHQCGSQAIDSIFVTTGLLGHVGGYLSGLAGVIGDHHCLWLNLPEQWIFGGNMPAIVWAGACQLKSDDPCT